jgi:uncharacterized membrane protein
MRPILSTVAALSLALPASYALPGAASDAVARTRHYSSHAHYVRCRHSKGTAGLVVGGVGGALVGGSVIGHGIVGPAVGAVGGALGGRAIDRSITRHKRCR